MEIIFSETAAEQIDDLPPRIRKEIVPEIKKLQGEKHPKNSKLIQDRKGRTLSRLRIKTERNEFRVLYRLTNTEIQVLAIMPRDECYDEEFWDELEKVFREMN